MLEFHQWCMSDPVAIPAYERAIERLVRPGDIFLDLGAGAGILGLHALRCGAAHVHAVEGGAIGNVIGSIAAANGYADRITVHRRYSFDIDLPEKADIVVASMLDEFGITNNLVGVLRDARARLLKPGARVIPSAIQLSFAPVEITRWYGSGIDCWETPRLGLDFSSLRTLAVNRSYGVRLNADCILASPGSFAPINLKLTDNSDVSCKHVFTVTRAGLFHGFAGWFELEMAEANCCTNSPFEVGRLPWNIAVFPVDRAVAVEPGDRIEASVRMVEVNHAMTSVWTAKIVDADGSIKGDFRHSTFAGRILAKEDLSAGSLGKASAAGGT
jgi:precorrin-6B methylase 2